MHNESDLLTNILHMPMSNTPLDELLRAQNGGGGRQRKRKTRRRHKRTTRRTRKN